MNFFRAQDDARRRTLLLVGLFSAAVLCLIVLTCLLVAVFFNWFAGQSTVLTDPEGRHLWLERSLGLPWTTFAWIAVAIASAVALVSLFRLLGLRAGGRAVAEAVGARRIDADTADPHERRLLNVVEEMAIAAGLPVPPVYVLADEAGINAFAAGYGPADAVVAVTRGTLTLLDRDQLQGVVAHEFSHILNGDMRLNIRLIAVLAGILFIGQSGRFFIQAFSRSRIRSRRDSGAPALVLLGLGLMAIGAVGVFFGNLIKAAVSRQREFLADASAVQFTRHPEGIAGALKRIGGHSQGAHVNNPGAGEISHFFFCDALHTGFSGLFATHPPLAARIRAIEPGWDGQFLTPPARTAVDAEPPAATGDRRLPGAGTGALAAVAATAASLEDSIASTGQPQPAHIDQARQLIDRIPALLRDAAHNPWAVRAAIHALLIDSDPEIRERQLAALAGTDPDLADSTRQLAALAAGLDTECRLPLVEMAMPALKQLSASQFHAFQHQLRLLAQADQHISTFEWVLVRLIQHDLGPAFDRARTAAPRYRSPAAVPEACQALLAFLAGHDADDAQAAQAAYQAGADSLGLSLPYQADVSLQAFGAALDTLALCYPLAKPALLKACVRTLTADGRVSASEGELLRAVAAILDCPMPPLALASAANAP